jgi:hypothetical protein
MVGISRTLEARDGFMRFLKYRPSSADISDDIYRKFKYSNCPYFNENNSPV